MSVRSADGSARTLVNAARIDLFRTDAPAVYIASRTAGNALCLQTTQSDGTLRDALHLTEGGNVGVGTTTPADMIDVYGRIRVSRGGNAYLYMFGGDATSTNPTLTSVSPEANKKPIVFQALYLTGGTPAGAATFAWQTGTTTSPTTRMHLSEDGRLALGGGQASVGAGLDIDTKGVASSLIVPRDTTANRPATPLLGMLRYNTTTTSFEVYEPSPINAGVYTWQSLLTVAPQRLLYADTFENPNNANWFVATNAPATSDATNPALTVRAFDDSISEGVGFFLSMPPTPASTMVVRLRGRPATAPSSATSVVMALYTRTVSNGTTAMGAWTLASTPSLTMSTNANYQTFNFTWAFTAAAGSLVQFELIRLGGNSGDTLVGDWLLLEIAADFY